MSSYLMTKSWAASVWDEDEVMSQRTIAYMTRMLLLSQRISNSAAMWSGMLRSRIKGNFSAWKFSADTAKLIKTFGFSRLERTRRLLYRWYNGSWTLGTFWNVIRTVRAICSERCEQNAPTAANLPVCWDRCRPWSAETWYQTIHHACRERRCFACDQLGTKLTQNNVIGVFR